MDIAFYLKKIITALILPPTSLLILAALGLIVLKRFARTGYALVWSSVALMLVLSLPAVSTSLLRSVSPYAPLQPGELGQVGHIGSDAATSAGAIVILGGGRRDAPEYGGETIASLALERVRYGAKLARETNLPILVTGGVVFGQGQPEAEMMAQALDQSFGMQARWIESRSRDTHENAQFSDELLKAAQIDGVILVTQDFHMRRSVTEFEAVGLRVIPAPVTYISDRRPRSFPEQLPSANALLQSSMALHELLGYWVARH